MAGSDYSLITAGAYPQGGVWEAPTESPLISLLFHVHKTGMLLNICSEAPGKKVGDSFYAMELGSGVHMAKTFRMVLWKDQDSWLYGYVIPFGEGFFDKPFAFAGFYNGEGTNTPVAEARLRLFLARQHISEQVIRFGQDDPAVQAQVLQEQQTDAFINSLSATADVIQCRAAQLCEALSTLKETRK